MWQTQLKPDEAIEINKKIEIFITCLKLGGGGRRGRAVSNTCAWENGRVSRHYLLWLISSRKWALQKSDRIDGTSAAADKSGKKMHNMHLLQITKETPVPTFYRCVCTAFLKTKSLSWASEWKFAWGGKEWALANTWCHHWWETAREGGKGGSTRWRCWWHINLR